MKKINACMTLWQKLSNPPDFTNCKDLNLIRDWNENYFRSINFIVPILLGEIECYQSHQEKLLSGIENLVAFEIQEKYIPIDDEIEKHLDSTEKLKSRINIWNSMNPNKKVEFKC